MEPRTHASLLWGAVGALSFLVLGQAYRLLFSPGLGLPALFAVAVLVFAIAAGASHRLDRRLAEKRQV